MAGSFLKEHDGFVLKLKIKSPDGTTQIRRVRLPRIADASGNVSFQELVGLCVTFTVPEGSPANYQVTLTYFDVDEDTITIASTDELVDAIEQFSEVKVLRVATEVKAKQASHANPAECARKAKPVPACKRKGHVTHGHPSLQEPDPIAPQVHKVLKSFVGILSHAVNHVQEGLANAPPAVARQSSPSPVNSAPAGPFPGPNPSAPLDPAENISPTDASPFIHFRHTCDGCHTSPIIGKRFRAIDHPDYDLCERCFVTSDIAGLAFEETVSEGDRIYQPAFRFCQPEAADTNAANDAAAEPEAPTPFIHGRHTCDSCLTTPIVGKRFHAVNLPDYDLCEKCHTSYTGTSVSFMEAELDRDRPFQARWQRRHEKMEKFHSRKERLHNARNRCENRRCRGGQALGRATPSTPMPPTETNVGPTNPPTAPVCVGRLNETMASSENRTYEFDDALKEAIRRSLRDIVPEENRHLAQGSQTFESPSSPLAVNDNMTVETAASANEPINPEESVILTEPEESLPVHLSLEDTKAMEDAMETDSVDSEKLLSESEEKASPVTIERSDTGNTQFSKDASFASEAAGSGEVAEAVGTTLDLVAGMITDMLLDISHDTPTPGENLEDDPKHHADKGQTSSEEGEWLVVEQGDDIELNMPDEEMARAAEMLGSALFNSITREPDDEQDSEDHMSTLSDSFSLPSTMPSINVGDSQRARWSTQLEQLRELGFDDESKCVDILERLQAANIGVESEEDVTVTHVVNMILEGK